MATNELIIKEDGTIDTTSLNKSVENQYIAMAIKCKNVKASKGNIFKSVKGYMVLDTYDIEGNYLGEFAKWLDVHFTKEAFDNCMASDIKRIDDLSMGTLYVLSKYLQAPSIYRPKYKKDKNNEEVYDENGNQVIEYPQIWVKGGIVGFIPYTSSQDKFNRKAKNQNVQDAEVLDAKDLDKQALDLTNQE